MKKQLFLLLVSALPFTLMAQAPLKGPLDGKTYSAEIIKEGKKKPLDPDELKFTAGKFKSKIFGEMYGFKKQATYIVTSVDSSKAEEKVYTWTAESINDIKDVALWEGTITGEEMEGTAVITTAKGDKKLNYTYSGKLKKKPGQK